MPTARYPMQDHGLFVMAMQAEMALMHIRTSSVATMLAITKHGVCVC